MVNSITLLFFELIQIAVGTREKFSVPPTVEQWPLLLSLSTKQSLAGVLLEGMANGLLENQKIKSAALYEWIGIQQQTIAINKNHTKKAKELSEWFKALGYNNCVLKGLGVGLLYPNPELRQSGDIDIWVDGARDSVVVDMRARGIDVGCVDYVNCHALFFKDIEVEVHFRPTYFYNPVANRKLQKWLQDNKQKQMGNTNLNVGFCYPTVAFNLVFCMIHTYRHVFSEGIGLRQLMDYYFILTHSTKDECIEALITLKTFGLAKFAGTVMYIMRRVFNMDESLLLCEPNKDEGEFLLSEIMRGGNFGHYDDRNTYVSEEKRFLRGLNNFKRNIRFLRRYPSEVMWMPVWKTWHWGWRKWKGYL